MCNRIRRKQCSIAAFFVFFPLGAVLGGGNDTGPESVRLRKLITSRPRTFENEVYFGVDGTEIIRSPRFVTESGLFGDFDGDGDVDLHDYKVMHICYALSGPGIVIPPTCDVFDHDADGACRGIQEAYDPSCILGLQAEIKHRPVELGVYLT